jgi:5-formyltetrahydrofolate cyclo-ligase
LDINVTSSTKLPHSKAALRKLMRQRRRQLSHTQQTTAAKKLLHKVGTSVLFRFRRRITFSFARDGEINPNLLLREALRRGKECYLPVMNKVGTDRLYFRRWQKGQKLITNRYGIPEPLFGQLCTPLALGLVLVPLVAFDDAGNRLGMGKGYYDKTFAFLRRSTRQSPVLLGLAHECQRVEKLEVASWDVPLSAIVTDKTWHRSSAQQRNFNQ